MSGRIYAVPMAFTAQSAVLDAFEIKSTAACLCELLCVKLGQTTILTDANEIIVPVVIKRASGSYTSGSGGGTPTPVPMFPSDVAASFTVETRNTTQAVVGTGTLTTIDLDAWNLRAPYLWLPPSGMVVQCGISSAIIVSIDGDPGTSVSIGGVAYVKEIGT